MTAPKLDDAQPFPWSQIRRKGESENEHETRERAAKETYAADAASCAETMALLAGLKP